MGVRTIHSQRDWTSILRIEIDLEIQAHVSLGCGIGNEALGEHAF